MAAPSSAKVRAPKKLSMPPTTQTPSTRMGDWTATAMDFGTRKIPDPMTPPTTMPMTSQIPSTLGRLARVPSVTTPLLISWAMRIMPPSIAHAPRILSNDCNNVGMKGQP